MSADLKILLSQAIYNISFAYFCWKICSIQHRLNNPGHKGGTVEAALILRDGDKGVDQRLLLNYVVRPLVVIGVLELVRLLPEQSFPQSCLDHQQGVEKLELPLGGPVTDKHQVQDPGPDLEPEIMQLTLELRDCAGPGLR